MENRHHLADGTSPGGLGDTPNHLQAFRAVGTPISTDSPKTLLSKEFAAGREVFVYLNLWTGELQRMGNP